MLLRYCLPHEAEFERGEKLEFLRAFRGDSIIDEGIYFQYYSHEFLSLCVILSYAWKTW